MGGREGGSEERGYGGREGEVGGREGGSEERGYGGREGEVGETLGWIRGRMGWERCERRIGKEGRCMGLGCEQTVKERSLQTGGCEGEKGWK